MSKRTKKVGISGKVRYRSNPQIYSGCCSCRPANTWTIVRHKVRDPTFPKLPPDLLSTTPLLLVPDWLFDEAALGGICRCGGCGQYVRGKQITLRLGRSVCRVSGVVQLEWFGRFETWQAVGYIALQTDLYCLSAQGSSRLETDRETSSRGQPKHRGHGANYKLRYGASLRKLVKSESSPVFALVYGTC
jgi:hypothetical protein